MQQIIRISIFILTLTLSNVLNAQIIWQEDFLIPDKGYWVNASGQLQSDLSGVDFNVDISASPFAAEGDYAKTVSTSGGRFEVVDSDGDVVFYSPEFDISGFDAVSVSLKATEIGSSSDVSKKFLKAFKKINGGELIPFAPDSGAFGNWGEATLKQSGIVGDLFQLVVVMNSSYSSDKVILDEIVIEGVDSTLLRPSKIVISNCPLFTFIEDTLEINAVVKNGMNELFIDSSVTLEFTGNNFNVLSSSFLDGIYSWKVQSSKEGKLNFAISDSKAQFSTVDSSLTFFSKSDAVLIEKFEGSDFQDWNFNQQWEISTETPIDGLQSIKHIRQEVLRTSELVFEGLKEDIQLNSSDFFFSFKLMNGNWDPSNTNSFYFLLSDNKTGEKMNGYAIGVNASESSDLLSMWRVDDGSITNLVCETAYDWNENSTVQINLQRTSLGNWILNVVDLKTGVSYTVENIENKYNQIDQLKLVFNYTASRSGLLWFDDLMIVKQNSAPYILSITTESDNRVKVVFNEPVNVDKLVASNFKIQNESGANIGITSIEKLTNTTIILSTSKLNEPEFFLSITGVEDLEGQMAVVSHVPFEFSLPAQEHDLIFTEIMADPNPPVALPETEFIEIHNRSQKIIQLYDSELFVKNSVWKLGKKQILPGEYVVLCNPNDSILFAVFGTVLPVEKFPALLNSGVLLRLTSANGIICDEVTYSDEWYNDDLKDNGGYSLERIDLNRFCGDRGNWSASSDVKGGTPGTVNSVSRNNNDIESPILEAVDILSYTQLNVYFSEPLDSMFAVDRSNYSIQGLSIQSVGYTEGELFVNLTLSTPVKLNTEYFLKVKKTSDDCGNLAQEQISSFSMVALAAGDVVINEVLYNPYTDGADFVELYNKKNVPVDLAELKLATRNDSLKLTSVYNLSKIHRYMPANSYMAFTKDVENISQNYAVPYPDNLVEMESFPAYGNEQGKVVLLNDSMQVLDEFEYSSGLQVEWLSDQNGVSLERLSIEGETNDPANWNSASSLVGYATPGYANSQTEINPEEKNGIELISDVVSPNGDGYNDELVLKFTIDQTGYLANVYIFDASGHEVHRLTNNDLLGNKIELSYDLKDGNGELLSMGVYLIYTELTHLQAKRKVFKQAFLITDKQ